MHCFDEFIIHHSHCEPGSRFNPEQRKSLYGGTDVLLVAFRVVVRETLESIRERFIPEIQESCAGIPIILVGMQIDQRDEGQSQSCAQIFPKEGDALAVEFGAVKYLECSARTGEGVLEVFETVSPSSTLFSGVLSTNLHR